MREISSLSTRVRLLTGVGIAPEALSDIASDIAKLEAENKRLTLSLAARNAVIKELSDDIRYYRKNRQDEMIQDQGLPVDGA